MRPNQLQALRGVLVLRSTAQSRGMANRGGLGEESLAVALGTAHAASRRDRFGRFRHLPGRARLHQESTTHRELPSCPRSMEVAGESSRQPEPRIRVSAVRPMSFSQIPEGVAEGPVRSSIVSIGSEDSPPIKRGDPAVVQRIRGWGRSAGQRPASEARGKTHAI